MGDQLLSSDQLACNICLFTNPSLAERRANIRTIERSIPVYKCISKSDEWYAIALKESAVLAANHIKYEHSIGLINGDPFRLDTQGKLRGNYCVWIAFRDLLKLIYSKQLPKDADLTKFKSRFKYSVESMLYRSGSVMDNQEKSRIRSNAEILEDEIAQLSYYEASLWEIHYYRSTEHNQDVWDYKRNNELKDVRHDMKFHKVVKQGFIDLFVLGPLIILKVGKNGEKLVMTRIHFERFLKMVRTTLLFSLATWDLKLRIKGVALFLDLIDQWWVLIEEDTDFLGEALKAARQYMISMLDRSMLSGIPLTKLYAKSIDPRRAAYAKLFASRMRSYTSSPEDAINLTNIFKMVPHPDTNMYELFQTIKAVRDPNPIDPAVKTRFEGTLRRAIYTSLTAQGVDVRVNASNELGEKAEKLAQQSRKQTAVMRQLAPSTWANTTFDALHNFVKISDIKVSASSKSSQSAPPFTEDDLDLCSGYSAGLHEVPPRFLIQARTVNDAASEAIGISHLDAKSAIRRFYNVIKLHEEFESRYPGMNPDDIPSNDLEMFLMSNENARYLVGTEPKFGELHKKVTRMFYMAQQELKAITQRIERYTKQISRRQPGVSITKSYPARRKDLETFCRNMVDTPGGERSVYVSFDMSEFSKKFPMELVRVYGKVLAELSGEKWLRRIDLVFRATVVIHNSRGYFSHLSGVKGGFEGFFNFVWSSIHATIMEVALESTGLSGEILVFSDDGCLLFYVPKAMENSEIWRRIVKVQEVYSKHGLNFNLGKSMVSTHLWEYLGDVCYDNKLLPMWIKEVTAITRNMKNRGLEPFYSKIKSLQAQCDAVISAGGPPDLIFIVKRFLFGSILDRLRIPYSPRLEELLSVVPTSCGGLRIMSPYESCITSTIEKDSEFIADLMLISTFDHELYKVIINNIYIRLKGNTAVVPALLSGTRFVTDHMDTSGMSIINETIDIIRNSPKVAKVIPTNPINMKFNRLIRGILKGIDNINLEIISDLIFSTPSWTNYMEMMSVVRSSGVLRLIPRREVKRLQSQDTRTITNMVLEWRNALYEAELLPSPVRLDKFIERATAITFKDLRIARMRPSPRIALTKETMQDGIQVKIQFKHAKTVSSMQYIEPSLPVSKDMLAISWYSEATGDMTVKSTRQYMLSLARVLSHSPESESAMISLSMLLGVEVPVIPPALVRSAHRLGGSSGRNVDCRIFLPRWFESLSESRYYGNMAVKLYNEQRADRTTYLQAARVLAFLKLRATVDTRTSFKDEVIIFNFGIDCKLYEPMHIYTPMVRNEFDIPTLHVNPLPQQVIEEYIAAYVEYVETNNLISMIDATNYLATDLLPIERKMVNEIYTVSLKRWIVNAYHFSNSTLIPSVEIELPRPELASLLSNAVIEASLSIMEPILRRRLLDNVNNWSYDMKNKESREEVYDQIINTGGYKAFVRVMSDITNILISLVPINYPLSDLTETLNNDRKICNRLASIASASSLVGDPHLIIVRGGTYLKGKMTPAHRSAFREAFTSTLSSVLTICNKVNWDEDEIKARLKIGMNVDELLNCLIVTRNLLRESHHRTVYHPYNQTSATIELYKFYHIVHSIIDDLRMSGINSLDELTEEEMIEVFKETKLRGAQRINLEAHFNLKNRSLGEDHIRMLDEGLHPESIARARLLVRYALNHNYLGIASREAMISSIDKFYCYTVIEILDILTSFYESVIIKAVRSITEYPTEIERHLLTAFSPSTPVVSQLINIYSNHREILSEDIGLNDLTGDEKNIMYMIASHHLEDLAYRGLIKGFNYDRSIHDDTPLMIGKLYDVQGPKVSVYSHSLNDISSYYIYFLKTNSIKKLLSDFYNLSSSEHSSLTIFQDRESKVYHLIGVSDKLIVSNPDVDEDSVSISMPNNVSVESVVPCISASERLGYIMAVRPSRAQQVSFINESLVLNRSRFASVYSRVVSGYRQVNSTSELLQAALDEIKDGMTDKSMFSSYIAMLLFVTGKERPEFILPLAKKVYNKIKGSDRREMSKYMRDISLVSMWMATSAIGQGSNLDQEKIMMYRKILREVKNDIRIPPGVMALVPRNLISIRNDLLNQTPSQLAGTLSDFIFEPESIIQTRMIEDEVKASDFYNTVIDDYEGL